MRRERPDVLFIVMDCARQAEFGTTSGTSPSIPSFRSLGTEALTFDRAISPASWTLPAHASLFTGLYPWQHGVSSIGRGVLSPHLTTLPGTLRDAGYRTASFSANPHISPITGMTRGFETAYWGGFDDCSLRPVTGARSILCSYGSGGTTSTSLERADPRGVLKAKLRSIALRAPWAYDAGIRAYSYLNPTSRAGDSRVAPWIEPKLREWLSHTPRDMPAFAFVNLLDAHEPYYGLPRDFPGFGEWIRLFWSSQRETALLDAPFRRTARTLHTLYTHAIEVMDKRIAQITDLFRELRRWEDCLVVVTSDHGQAFGEEGSVYHRWGYADTLFHVPLLVRYPEGEGAPGRWPLAFSTRQIPSLIVRACGIGNSRADEQAPGRGLPDGPGEGTILSLADHQGFSAPTDDRAPPSLSLPGIGIVAYARGKKFVVPVPTGPLSDRSDPVIGSEIHRTNASEGSPEDRAGRTLALEAASSMQSVREEFYDGSTDRRLRGWGYA
jgi:arylsulfatase A-like enzyme